MKEITITFENGSSKIETKGFRGGECKDATKALKEALGTVTSEEPTREASLTQSNNAQTKQR
jgi:hypothetical protein